MTDGQANNLRVDMRSGDSVISHESFTADALHSEVLLQMNAGWEDAFILPSANQRTSLQADGGLSIETTLPVSSAIQSSIECFKCSISLPQ